MKENNCNSSNTITLRSVGDLAGNNYFIPSYQRGYRWKSEQVEDLLNDIYEFIGTLDDKMDNSKTYCLQPLVIKKLEKTPELILQTVKQCSNPELSAQEQVDRIKNILRNTYVVIDGQQRLTTIKILLSYLQPSNSLYCIEYETRQGSSSFIDDIASKNDETAVGNVDYYHMWEAYKTIKSWFESTCNKTHITMDYFKDVILQYVKFIEYEVTGSESEIDVFTRLNKGTIKLTDSELVKALYLNEDNYRESNTIFNSQFELAHEWDEIETVLQNDEFWLFVRGADDDKATRIGFIFDLIYANNTFEEYGIAHNQNKKHRIFRYFYDLYQKCRLDDTCKLKFVDTWKTVSLYFNVLREWYNDLELYHYIGYLVACDRICLSNKIIEYINAEDKHEYKNQLKKDIRSILFANLHAKNDYDTEKLLDLQYEISPRDNPNKSPIAKTACRSILLFHNIESIVQQNKCQLENEKYKSSVFYKFPFHIYKKEKWDVEHIDSNTENPLTEYRHKKEWIKCAAYALELIDLEETTEDESKAEVRNKMLGYLKKDKDWDSLHKEIVSKLEDEFGTKKNNEPDTNSQQSIWDEFEKNKIKNFCLLDASTNRGYGNSLFPVKRLFIKAKEQGKFLNITDDLKTAAADEAKTLQTSFIPNCTRNVFMKYYSPNIVDAFAWDDNDATSYKENIKQVIDNFIQTIK